MKIVCIDNRRGGKDYWPLTIGKSYETNGGPPAMYNIDCDDGKPRSFSTSRFLTLDEYRNKKLNDIGV